MSDNQTLTTIFNRSSYRGSFKNESVPRADLVTILKAGIAAPSGCNRQTPSFIAVDEETLVKEIKQIFPNSSCQTAPAFILVFTQEIAGVDGRFYNVQDYGAAVENMLLAIKSLGYDTCWYEGGVRRYTEQISSLLCVPKDLRMVCLLPVGIAAEEVIPAKGKKSFEERAWFNLDAKSRDF
ncbi:MAG: nitroreductase [Lachnospiraceae bacterium]|nr:nitroreductase [Lachnospiraceae bacterium]